MDSMDQNKTMLPHFAKPPKSTDGMWKTKTHLLAAKVHGVGIYGFFDFFQYPHGSNLTITSLLSIIDMMKDSLPDILYLQMDNCGRENKNRYVLAFLCHLVETGVFRKIKLSFLMKGHTHEDIDQLFSRFSVWLNKNNALTVEELMKGFEECFTPNPMAIKQSCVLDYSNWITTHINPITRHSKPHVFKISKENGKAKISCKKWSTDKVYLECIGTESFLLNTLPCSEPRPLTPVYDLEKAKDNISMAYPFMSASQIQNWNSFFQEKEEEEITFCDDSNNESINIRTLTEHIRNKRLENHCVPGDVPQIVSDGDEMQPVVIGKNLVVPTSSIVKAPPEQSSNLEVGDMVLTNMEKYNDEWPQVAQVVDVTGGDVTVQWYKGSKSTSWLPCTIPVPGQRGKRMPWTERIQKEDIWLTKFTLTNKQCLPKHVKKSIDQFEAN